MTRLTRHKHGAEIMNSSRQYQEGRETSPGQVRVLHGEAVQPWRTFDECSGSWKFPGGILSESLGGGSRAEHFFHM